MTKRLDPSLIPDAPNLEFEQPLWQAGCNLVAGVDEAGRGAWAGPVAAAAVILPCSAEMIRLLTGVRDSKELTPESRAHMAPVIKEAATGWAVGFAEASEIDRFGIIHATRLAMMRALAALKVLPAHLLIDALFLPEIPIPQTSLIKGDQRSLSIAAASIVAKTSRDTWMVDCAARFPQYGFARHKGYGTGMHQERLSQYGPCDIHRRSFEPIKALVTE